VGLPSDKNHDIKPKELANLGYATQKEDFQYDNCFIL
jgi:hypothetical protein